jgi:predicted RNA-binding Zn ribbon-like protein
MTARSHAAGVLGLVQAYASTVDQAGLEQLGDPGALAEWLIARSLMSPLDSANAADLRHAIAVREAIRSLIGANSGARVYPVDIATLNQASAASRLRARFGPDGKTRLEPEAAGVEGALGRIVAAVFEAIGGERWTHLKLCGSHSCRKVFYDHSRNRSSRWCDMASCGNRQKALRFRQRAKTGAKARA